MKRIYEYLIFSFLATILLSCSKNDMKGKWIYSLEYGVNVYSGMIYDFENKPMTRYSLLVKNYCDTISLKDSILFRDTRKVGTIIRINDKCIVIKGLRDSLVFHKVPDLHLADSIIPVFNFLTSNPISYKDDFYNLKYYFDTTLNDENFYNSSFKDPNYPQYGLSSSSWKLEIVNGSIVLLNQDPNSLFPSNLLITNITNYSISGIILGFPENMQDSIKRAVSNHKYLDFEYESFSLTKANSKTKEEIGLLREKLTSKNWNLFKIDSTYISHGRIFPRNKSRVFPSKLNGLKYKFTANNNYEISTKDSIYKGQFDISIDGNYIVLDKNMNYDNCIEILEADSSLKIEQIMKLYFDDREYKTYNCKIELK